MRNAKPTPQGPCAELTRPAHRRTQRPAWAAPTFSKGSARTPHWRSESSVNSDSTSHVLIADDNVAMKDVVMTILRVAGFDTRGVDNGADAIEAVQHGDYDLVLMDIEMPKLNGIDATRAIRALPNAKSRVPIVAFTGNVTLEDQESFYQAGMNDFAPKPIAADELVALVEQWTGDTPPDAEERAYTPPLLEPMILADLEAVIGRESMTDLLVLFDETAGTHADAMRRAGENQGLDMLAKNAHDLKSVAGNCGFSRLSRHAAAIETACKDGDATHAFALARHVDKILAESRVLLKATYPDMRARLKASA